MGYIMSLDGGGSKLLCLVADTEGNLVGSGVGGAANSNFVGEEIIKNSLRTCVLEAMAAGGIRPDELAVVNATILADCKRLVTNLFLEEFHSSPEIHVCSEFDMSLYGAVQEEYGALVQAGTGSFACVRTPESNLVVGGRGAFIGDEGSGFYIGYKALVACIRMEEGTGPGSVLREYILSALGAANTGDITSKLFNMTIGEQRKLLASLCPLVGRCADAGDGEAIKIIDKAARHLSRLLAAAYLRSNVKGRISASVSGGAWKTSPLLFQFFLQHIKAELQEIKIYPPLFEPAAGGILLGLKEIGYPVREQLDALAQKLSGFAYSKNLFKYRNL